MPGRMVRPKGTRVSFTIPPGLATIAMNSPAARAALFAKGEEIEARAQRDVPVGQDPPRHGVHLRDTFVKQEQITPAGPVLILGYTAYWAHFVHNGTVKLAANPWLLNAALDVLVAGRVAGSRRAA